MKKLFISLIVLLSLPSFGADKATAQVGVGYDLLDSVADVKRTTSEASGLAASAIQILARDGGVNPSQLLISLRTDNHEAAKVYLVKEFIMGVTRITFLDKDVIVVNYVKGDFDAKGDDISVNKSVKITVLRDAKGELTNEILQEEITKK